MNATELKQLLTQTAVGIVKQYYMTEKNSMDAGKYGVLSRYFRGIESSTRRRFGFRKTDYNCWNVTWSGTSRTQEESSLAKTIQNIEQLISECHQQASGRESKFAKTLNNALRPLIGYQTKQTLEVLEDLETKKTQAEAPSAFSQAQPLSYAHPTMKCSSVVPRELSRKTSHVMYVPVPISSTYPDSQATQVQSSSFHFIGDW